MMMQKRSFALAANSATKPRVPLQLYGIDGRYATALYSASLSNLKQTHADLTKLREKLNADKKLHFVLTTPIFGRTIKLARIDALVATTPVCKNVYNFFALLADNGRLDQLDKISAKFESLISAANGEVTVVVTSAQELDKPTHAKLAGLLKGTKLLGANQHPKLVSKVDPEILGGLIIEVDGKTIDLSVASKVNKLNRLISEAI